MSVNFFLYRAPLIFAPRNQSSVFMRCGGSERAFALRSYMSSFTAYCGGATSVTRSGVTMVLIYCSAYSHFSGRPSPNHLPEENCDRCFTTSRNHIRTPEKIYTFRKICIHLRANRAGLIWILCICKRVSLGVFAWRKHDLRVSEAGNFVNAGTDVSGMMT